VQKWTFTAGGAFEASAVVSNGALYIGSWDGYEYSLDPVTGTQNWKTFIDQTTLSAGCNSPWPDTQGVSSTATVSGSTLYVGGGGQYWYALGTDAGQKLFKIDTGDPNNGYYNWASPLVANGYGYINIASGGNCPSVQGAVMQVNLTSQSVTHTFDVVPNGQQGGAVWSSPAFDTVTNKVFVSTGSVIGVGQDNEQPYAQAILALDANSLALLDSWQLPQAEDQGDDDFGATPTLFTDSQGDQLIGCANKNGTFYVLDRNDLDAGPVWQTSLAPNGNPGTIAAAAFDGTNVYAVGNGTEVYALNPANGTILWHQAVSGTVLAPLAVANGLLVVADGDTLEVRATSSGDILFSAQISTDPNVTLSAAPSIANGFIYQGTGDGTLYAFGLP
jgi:outer membrane protein assembly factor BamB